MFKRKVKQSDWMRGLLEAEKLYKNGYRVFVPTSVYGHLVNHLWFRKEGDDSFRYSVGLRESYQMFCGYIAYIDYFNKYL